MLLSPRNKNLLKLIVIIIIFMLPLLIAQYLYYYGNITGAQTNKGNLINNPHNLLEFNLTSNTLSQSDEWQDNRWRIIFIAPEKCQKTCSSVLYRLQQVHIALGKNTNRLQRLNIHTVDYTKNLEHWTTIYDKYPHMTMSIYKAEHANKDSLLNNFDPSSIYIADPLGNIILSYDTTLKNFEDFDTKIFKDIKKLLNISKIG
jgi:hypothetical protein